MLVHTARALLFCGRGVQPLSSSPLPFSVCLGVDCGVRFWLLEQSLLISVTSDESVDSSVPLTKGGDERILRFLTAPTGCDFEGKLYKTLLQCVLPSRMVHYERQFFLRCACLHHSPFLSPVPAATPPPAISIDGSNILGSTQCCFTDSEHSKNKQPKEIVTQNVGNTS